MMVACHRKGCSWQGDCIEMDYHFCAADTPIPIWLKLLYMLLSFGLAIVLLALSPFIMFVGACSVIYAEFMGGKR